MWQSNLRKRTDEMLPFGVNCDDVLNAKNFKGVPNTEDPSRI